MILHYLHRNDISLIQDIGSAELQAAEVNMRLSGDVLVNILWKWPESKHLQGQSLLRKS